MVVGRTREGGAEADFQVSGLSNLWGGGAVSILTGQIRRNRLAGGELRVLFGLEELVESPSK